MENKPTANHGCLRLIAPLALLLISLFAMSRSEGTLKFIVTTVSFLIALAMVLIHMKKNKKDE